MKELETHIPEQTKIHAQTQQEKQFKHIGRVMLKKGLTMFELNIVSGLVQPANYEEIHTDFRSALKGETPIKRKLVIQQNCIYEQALNLENAIRKFKAKLEVLKQQSMQRSTGPAAINE